MSNETRPTLRAPSSSAPAPDAASTPAPTVVAPASVAAESAAPATPAPAANPQVLQVNVNDLAAIFAEAMKAVMTTANAPDNTAVLASALTAAIDASKPKAKITVANRQRFNPMNPTDRKRKFHKKVFQNFMEVDVADVTDVEYDLLNSPDLRPGQYLVDQRTGPLLEVLDVKRGAQIGLHLRYSNADINQRMNLESRAPGLVGKLAVCIAEHKTQVEDRKRRREAGEDLDD